MINKKTNKELTDKWLYYQDVKVLKTKVQKNEKHKKDIKDFRKFIDEQEDTKSK